MEMTEIMNEIRHIFVDVCDYELMATYELTNGNKLMDFELQDYGYVSCEVGNDIIKLSTTRYDLEPENSDIWYKDVEFNRLQRVVKYATSVKYQLTKIN